MSARARHFKLGLFILGALTLVVAFVVALGAGALFRKRTHLETYFDASVQGLDVGSAVKYRGVTVGQVSEITFTYARYEQDKPMAARRKYVMAIARVDPELIGLESGFDQESLQTAIEGGLRVRSTVVGITGVNYLELDYVPAAQHPPLPIDWDPEHLYIPSAPSAVKQITNAAEDLARRLQKLDVEGLLANIARLALTANTTLEQLQAGELAVSLSALLAEVRETNRRARALLARPELETFPRDAAAAASRLRELAESEDLRRTVTQLGQTLQGLNRLALAQGSDIAATLDSLRRMSENMRDLSESLKEYPGQLLRGAPPPARERR